MSWGLLQLFWFLLRGFRNLIRSRSSFSFRRTTSNTFTSPYERLPVIASNHPRLEEWHAFVANPFGVLLCFVRCHAPKRCSLCDRCCHCSLGGRRQIPDLWGDCGLASLSCYIRVVSLVSPITPSTSPSWQLPSGSWLSCPAYQRHCYPGPWCDVVPNIEPDMPDILVST